MTDLDRTATDRMIDVALAEELGGEEPIVGPDEILAAAAAAPAARVRSVRGPLELAAAAVLVAFALFALPRLLAPADAPKPAAPATLEDVLGKETAARFREETDGLRKVAVLAADADRLRKEGISREGQLLLGRAILDAFPWREEYDDAKHQRDLFELRTLATENDMTFLGGLFALLAKHPAAYVRLHALMDLRQIGAAGFADVAQASLDDPDERVRDAAYAALSDFGALPGEELLAKALKDPDPDVRRNAVATLGDYGRSERVRALVLSAVEDADAKVRMAAADRAVRAGDGTAVSHLIGWLPKETNQTAREVIGSAIGFLGRLEGPLRELSAVECAGKDEGGREDAAYLRAMDEETFAALAKGGLKEKPLDIEFPREMVLAVFLGRRVNTGGLNARFFEDNARIYVRVTPETFQTEGGGETHRPWSLFVLPRLKKPVVFFENVQNLIGYPPVWKERARLPALE